ncbi:MAG: DUF3179 domain-containing protein [Candidatus Pacebacteria bacterium]|nr:DUF3179 domain-containing protein [Candidatus Paceibacterota bacterium]
MNKKYTIIFISVVAILFVAALLINSSREDQIETAPTTNNQEPTDEREEESKDSSTETTKPATSGSVAVTPTSGDGEVFEEIPDSEILSGGPGKDGIPSIDDPKFVSVKKASFLNNEDIGIALQAGDEARFYPFQILVWHEIVNDTVGGVPLAVTYCPLCFTGITYERKLDGKVVEFGVSGMLWKSNLVMYDRTANVADESLWSQVLGRAIKGPKTGERLTIYPSDTIKFGEWSKAHPDGRVLSRDTGSFRLYGTDPYGGYYTNRDVSFGASFSDTRLHPKEFVLGVEIDGQFKAYVSDALPVGTTTDTFAGKAITIEKSDASEVRISADGKSISHIGGFWFSWLAVHENTELYTK